jgi:hypothetical protein
LKSTKEDDAEDRDVVLVLDERVLVDELELEASHTPSVCMVTGIVCSMPGISAVYSTSLRRRRKVEGRFSGLLINAPSHAGIPPASTQPDVALLELLILPVEELEVLYQPVSGSRT